MKKVGVGRVVHCVDSSAFGESCGIVLSLPSIHVMLTSILSFLLLQVPCCSAFGWRVSFCCSVLRR